MARFGAFSRTRRPARRLAVWASLAALSGLAALGASDAVAATGDLTQKPGLAGCVSDTGVGPCADGTALSGANSVVVSPDGRSAYVGAVGRSGNVASDAGGVAVFDRAPEGTLTQKPGTAGCVTDTGEGTPGDPATAGQCVNGQGLRGVRSVAVSPDGSSAYVASYAGGVVAVFDRAPDGTLTQKPGTAGCISDTGRSNRVDPTTGGQCAGAKGLDIVVSVTVSPDGRSVYAGSLITGGVAVFDRAPDGTLTQKVGTAGCVTDNGRGRTGDPATAGQCAVGRALVLVNSVAVSPDGKSVYVGSRAGVAMFDRAPDGTLTQKPGAAGCVTETGEATPGDLATAGQCADGKVIDGARSVAVSPDGGSVYVAEWTDFGYGGVAVFDRAPNGTLAQKPGTEGCVTERGEGTPGVPATAGQCADGRALAQTSSVAVSPDGQSVYVASANSGAVAAFDRAPDGTLTQKPGLAGCVSDTGVGPCADGKALAVPLSVAVSPDGGTVYVASFVGDGVAVFDREEALNRPPVCAALAANPATLWPANGKLVRVQVAGATDPDGDPVTLAVTGVTQDEPVTGHGDRTSPDAARTPHADAVSLRAERSGHGDGRVYRIAVTATDPSGGLCTGTVKVGVPRERHGRAVDSGGTYDSLAAAPRGNH